MKEGHQRRGGSPITNLTFSKEYTAAVEAKQVAQQEAQRAKFIVSFCWRGTAGQLGRGEVRKRGETSVGGSWLNPSCTASYG
jgi:hypothetical protein